MDEKKRQSNEEYRLKNLERSKLYHKKRREEERSLLKAAFSPFECPWNSERLPVEVSENQYCDGLL